jgi:MtaA/CmuA family methyltransferase
VTSKQRCLAAIRGERVDRVPVFPLLMLLAADRAGMSYRKYATSGSALARAQLQVRGRFGLDAITACSDAFRLTADLGAEMAFPDDKPPFALKPLISSESDLAGLPHPDPARAGTRMADRVAALDEMCRTAGEECLVVGWVDMPFAEACSVCGVSGFMLMLVLEPLVAHRILEFLTGLVIEFALAQVEVGAPMIGAGDAAASLISPAMYREFALPYEQRVAAAVHDGGDLVKLHICGNTSGLLEDMVRSGCDLFNVDHMVDFEKARDVYTAAGKCYKGNLDPVADALHASPEECQARCLERLRLAEGTRFMLSAGCEIPAGVPDEVLRAFCDAPKVAS